MRDAKLTIVHIAPPQITTGGDFVYRLRQPDAALGRLPGVAAASITNLCSQRMEMISDADVLIIQLLGDPDLLPVVLARRRAGRPTVFEISDNFLNFQPSNPAAAFYENPENRACILQLISECDAVQTTVPALKDIFSACNGRIEVFENRMESLGDPERPDGPLVVGWGGSIGHYEDLRASAPPLIDWLSRHPEAHLAIMGDETFASLFSNAPAGRFRHTPPGSLEDYYKFVRTLHIGVAPLKDDPFNLCRSDVKFMEYASRGAVPVCSNVPTYNRTLKDGETGFLFDTIDEMISILDRLAADPGLRRTVARRAFKYIRDERMEDDGARARLEFYKSLFRDGRPAGTLSEERFGSIKSLGRTPGSSHYLHTFSNSERHIYNGLVFQFNRLEPEKAEASFRSAIRLDPNSYQAHLYLGNLLLNRNRKESESALRRAAGAWPESCEARMRLASLLAAKSDAEDASNLIRSIRRDCPKYAPAFSAEAEYLLTNGKTGEAAAFLEESLKANPYYAPAAMRLGAHMLETGNHQRAESLFRRAAETNPRLPGARYGLAASLAAAGREDEAADEFIEAIRLDPDSEPVVDAFLDIPLSRYKTGNLSGAKKLLLLALEAAPAQAKLLFWTARVTERAEGAAAAGPSENTQVQ